MISALDERLFQSMNAHKKVTPVLSRGIKKTGVILLFIFYVVVDRDI